MSIAPKRQNTNQSSGTGKTPDQRPIDKNQLSVGAFLKQTRLKYNFDLQEIANYLNIRRIHLENIEEERYNDLPGTVYVIGFIKSYCDYLGLDKDVMVNRFKAETGKQIQKTDFDIPVPIAESRLPDSRILTTSIILTVAFIGFAVWLFSGSKESQKQVNVVPSLEEVFEQDVLEQSGLMTQQEENLTSTQTQQNVQPEAKVMVVERIKDEEDASASPANSSLEGVVEAKEEAKPEQVQTEQASPASEAGAVQAVQPVQQEDNSLLAASGRATVYGSGNVDSRIAIKARQNSWIEIKDERNTILLSRVLKPEDVYYVPANIQSYLTTGNAGGLEIFIDGKFAGIAGKQGEVLRQYQLTVEGLIAP